MSEKPRIVNSITGYRRDENIDYLSIIWHGGSKSWTYSRNIKSYINLSKFIEKIESSIDILEHQKNNEEEERQKNQLRELIKKSNAIHRPQIVHGTKDKFQRSNYRPEHMSNRTSDNLNIPIMDKKDLKKERILGPLTKSYDSISESNTGSKRIKTDSNYKNPKHKNYKEYVAQKRYYEIPMPFIVPRKEIIASPKVKNVVKDVNNKLTLVYDDNHVGYFHDVINVISNESIDIKMFKASCLVSNPSLVIFLFSIYQNTEIYNASIFRLTLHNSVPNLVNIIDELNSNSYTLVDDTALDYNYLLLTSRLCINLIRWFTSDFILLKIPKTMFSKSCKYNEIILSTIQSDSLYWSRESLQFNSVVSNTILFNLEKYNIVKFKKYFILTSKDDVILQELSFLLQKSYQCKYDNQMKDINYIFINEYYIEYIHSLPNIHNLKSKDCRFIVINITILDMFYSSYEIYPEGGIITFDLNLLEQILDIPLSSTIISKLKDKDSKWVCKVTSKLYSDYKNVVLQHKGKLKYGEMCQVLNWLEKCVVETEVVDLKMFMKNLDKEFRNEYRMFYILNMEICDDIMITPEFLLRIMN